MRTILYRPGKMPMLLKISIGFFFGILFGFIAAPMIDYVPVLSNYIMPSLDLMGKIFLKLLTMIMVPLVFCSLVAGISSIGDTHTLGRIGFKTILLYIITTITAVFIGLACGYFIQPGQGVNIPAGLNAVTGTPKHFEEIILDIFPDNLLNSLISANMLQIIVFAFFLGTACTIAGEAGKKAGEFFGKAAEIMYSVTRIVMMFAPAGVFALIATTAANFGVIILAPFVKIIAAVYIGCILHALIIYSFLVIVFCKRSPFWFLRGIQEAAITAFVTRSSSVTLPVTLSNVQEHLGVSEGISSFVLPLGATINMDGTAIYHVIASLFVAQAYNVTLTPTIYAAVVISSVLASIGAAGLPGAGMIMLTMVLTSAGLPVEGVGLVAGIDVVLSSARTLINVMGDAAVCVVVASSEGENLTGTNPSGRMPDMNYGA